MKRRRDWKPVERSARIGIDVRHHRRPTRGAEHRVELVGRHRWNGRHFRQSRWRYNLCMWLPLPDELVLAHAVGVGVFDSHEVEASLGCGVVLVDSSNDASTVSYVSY